MSETTVSGELHPTLVAKTVDVQIRSEVLDAALARLTLIRRAERVQFGRSLSNLSTLAEKILKEWYPGQTKKPKPTPRATCPSCHERLSTYATGKLRVHTSGKQCSGGGKPAPVGKGKAKCPDCARSVSVHDGAFTTHDRFCPESYVKGMGPTTTRPLRFPMDKAEYTRVSEVIHMHGQSVASVITQRLLNFAKTGKM